MSAERIYIIAHESYWHNVRMNQNPTIMIKTDSGEMTIEWFDLTKGIKSPQIQIFHDSFGLFETEIELFHGLRTMKNATVEDVSSLLDTLGFEDKTKRENPSADKSEVATLRNRVIDLLEENHQLRVKSRNPMTDYFKYFPAAYFNEGGSFSGFAVWKYNSDGNHKPLMDTVGCSKSFAESESKKLNQEWRNDNG